jgi:hypothetical protein
VVMLLRVGNQLVETTAGTHFTAQRTAGQPLIEDQIGRLIGSAVAFFLVMSFI